MLRIILSCCVAFGLVLVMGPKVIGFMHKLHFGQTIYELGPQTHKSKQGTPIMGGLMICCAAVVCSLVFHPAAWQGFWDFEVGLLMVSLLAMLVGFADDWIKGVKKRHEGLKPLQKIAGQIVVGLGFACYCYFNPQVGSSIRIPFTGLEWDLGWWYIPLMGLAIIFMVNSSNLLDGLDGLLSSTSVVGNTGWLALALIALAAGEGAAKDNLLTLAVFAAAVVGGTLGFLRYNRFPAKIFQGDSGSMFIGGVTVGLALLLRQPLLMLLLDAAMVVSSVSVILQRGYFKLTHGKRIFKMSPLHHHFELSGYPETQVVSMYTVITAMLTIVVVLGQIRMN
ncbi:MAG: phospho-N-acetylmuramoyl-pentapeptide-transferase [Clostridia bacterium]|nr:phospho-N-acetylmuramoyl-pentapeptide-transferase [Clostridia bacterium]